MNSSSRQARQYAAYSSGSRPFSTSVASSSRTLPRPVATRPASQAYTAVPKNVYELTQQYPRHPLLAFFNQDTRKIKLSPDAKTDTEVSIPAALRRIDLSDDYNSRGWLAPELRTKSSLELHQLWYKCLMERNRIHTTQDELQRIGAQQLARFNQYNGHTINRRVRKTMARIKFVLNERRIALLQAQERAATTAERPVEESVVEGDEGPLYETTPTV